MKANNRCHIIGVGDLMLGEHPLSMGQGVLQSWQNFGREPFQLISEILGKADITLGNLECVISSVTNLGGYHASILRTPPEMAKVLKTAGITAVSVANNHTMDHGVDAFRATCRHLENAGILVCGTKDDPIIIDSNNTEQSNMRIALFGVSFLQDNITQRPLYTNVVEEGAFENLLDTIRMSRNNVDSIIVMCHWGDEFVTLPSPTQKKLAQQLFDAGADIILGHHPHVYQGMEIIEGKTVAYSLGNFVSDMKQPYLRVSALAEFILKRNQETSMAVYPVKIDRYNRPSISTDTKETEFIETINKRCHEIGFEGYDDFYKREQSIASRKYKRDSLFDFIRNIGVCPGKKIEIIIEALMKKLKVIRIRR